MKTGRESEMGASQREKEKKSIFCTGLTDSYAGSKVQVDEQDTRDQGRARRKPKKKHQENGDNVCPEPPSPRRWFRPYLHFEVALIS